MAQAGVKCVDDGAPVRILLQLGFQEFGLDWRPERRVDQAKVMGQGGVRINEGVDGTGFAGQAELGEQMGDGVRLGFHGSFLEWVPPFGSFCADWLQAFNLKSHWLPAMDILYIRQV